MLLFFSTKSSKLCKAIDGKETMELPRGMYFVHLNGTVQKIVVE